MTLTSLWIEQRSQLELEKKNVKQIISFAGDGRLRDGNLTSSEFREFLSHIPTSKLKQYLDECLAEKFDDGGYALQDIINQIGRRLGFKVTDGRYRGISSEIGFDGLWIFPDGHSVIAEVKTSDIYQINLDTIAAYRKHIIAQEKATEEASSILIILGREDRDTSGLEAQIRGSRYAWNIRIISVDALVRLMSLKEEIGDPKIIQQISAVLIPREFTKLDEIINLVFSTTEDLKDDEIFEDSNEEDSDKQKPVSFHDSIIRKIEIELQYPLIKRSKTTYSSADETTRLSCAISKAYNRRGQTQYWFAFHPYQKDFVEEGKTSFVSFGCGTEETTLLIPFQDFAPWLNELNTTTTDANRFYWHVHIRKTDNGLTLLRKRGTSGIDLNKYLV